MKTDEYDPDDSHWYLVCPPVLDDCSQTSRRAFIEAIEVVGWGYVVQRICSTMRGIVLLKDHFLGVETVPFPGLEDTILGDVEVYIYIHETLEAPTSADIVDVNMLSIS